MVGKGLVGLVTVTNTLFYCRGYILNNIEWLFNIYTLLFLSAGAGVVCTDFAISCTEIYQSHLPSKYKFICITFVHHRSSIVQMLYKC